MRISNPTPGPWRLHYDEDGYTGEIRGALDSDYDGCIADWVAEANARLIAAAPDLLEALEDMLAQAEFAAEVRGGEGHMKYAMSKARAAIAKAKGKA